MSEPSFLTEARKSFHAALIKSGILASDKDGVPSIADKHSQTSKNIAKGILEKIGPNVVNARLAGQMSGSKFEVIVGEFLEETLPRFSSIRPGQFDFTKGQTRLAIANSDQYSHLSSLSEAVKKDPDLAVAIGMDYLIKPDVMVLRRPEADERINSEEYLVGEDSGLLSSIRLRNNKLPILHASVSCKWTLRSDRAQNARSEALNLVRNRKGRLPHIVVVTAEPTPGRLASLALGTGDIDCVYHIALSELGASIEEAGYEDSLELFQTMVEGKRLRDISDLPLDLST